MVSMLQSASEPGVWLVIVLSLSMALGALTSGVYAIRKSRRFIEQQTSQCAACKVRLSEDAAERNRVLFRLAEQEFKLRAVIRSAPVCITQQSADGTTVEINPAGVAMLGCTHAEQVLNKSIYNFLCTECRDRYASLTERVFGGEEGRLEFDAIGKDRSVRRLEIHAVPIRAADGTVIAMLGIARDMTEQKRIADQLRENEARLRTIIESEPECVKLEAPDGTVLDMNPAGLAILEATERNQVIGKSVFRVIAPDYHEAYRAHVERVFRGEKSVLEFQMITTRGNLRWLETHAVPLLDPQGQVEALLGITRDVTARKQAEENLLQRQMELAHMCRLTNLGEMASGLAHELNQPLCAISTYADAVARTLKSGIVTETAFATLERISSQAERAGMIIRRLRDLVAKKQPELQAVNVNTLVLDVVELLQSQFKTNSVTVRCALANDLPAAMADPIQIEQVVLNLAGNAIDAMSQSACPRELTIETGVFDESGVAVVVRDSGPGVPSDLIEQVFAPFFTTKKNGIGMGLSISRSIIEAHNGQIRAENNSGGGTSFSFTLPVSREQNREEATTLDGTGSPRDVCVLGAEGAAPGGQ